jgi:hypothetical protein
MKIVGYGIGLHVNPNEPRDDEAEQYVQRGLSEHVHGGDNYENECFHQGIISDKAPVVSIRTTLLSSK